MNGRRNYSIDPWSITERHLDLDRIAHSESIFALSNGHIGVRGNLDEGEPHGTPGSYLGGFYESSKLPYAEGGYGYPQVGQSLVNVTNGKLVRLLVDDEPFDVRYGSLDRHERTLDLRDGVLRRDVRWTSPAGAAVRIRSTRLVSFAHRAIVAVRYEVSAIDEAVRIVVQSGLVANEPIPEAEGDPRTAMAMRAPLVGEFHMSNDTEVSLGHRTRSSELRMAAGLDHVVEGPEGTVTSAESEDDLARVTISTELTPGASLVVVKFLAYGWSASRSMPALRDQVDAALASARRTGWDGLAAEQRQYLDEFWDHADVQVDGDDELQQAVRFALFQVVQAAARAERRAIPAKGLTGRGYDGHTFWDQETYTLPALTYTLPEAAQHALLWRYDTLPIAQDRARELHLPGATFAWRTIHGEECSGYWPAGTAAFHINADIADAVRRYVFATGDTVFDANEGFDLLVETARLWSRLGHFDHEGRFRIDGVTGPDEYSAIADNNTFTNLMAQRNLREAAAVVRRHPDRAEEHEVGDDEVERWLRAADAMVVPFDERLGVTAQSEDFTRLRQWDFGATPPDRYPLLLHYPYYLLYSSQVVKQADLVFALYLCGDQFSPEQKRRDFDYYEQITVRDSSLSACIQAVVAAEVGHLELAFDYFRETALVDLRDQAGNTSDGLHLASLAGTWIAAVAGFGGMRDHDEVLSFSPRLPSALTRLSFRLLFQGRRLSVEMRPDDVTYELLRGTPLQVRHHGSLVALEPQTPVTLSWGDGEIGADVEPPPGREPSRQGIGAEPPPTHY